MKRVPVPFQSRVRVEGHVVERVEQKLRRNVSTAANSCLKLSGQRAGCKTRSFQMAKKRRKRRPRSVPQDKEILNAEEAAIVLGVSERLLLRLARDGEVPGKKIGREWRFLRSSLRNAISGQADEDALVKLLSKPGVKVSVGKKTR